jgi:RNA polymerase sigma-70 factor (ECF subfamily)
MEMTEPRADALLAHAGFIRALSHNLLLDPDRTDDIVQEALMAALKRPPRDRSKMRAWLGAVGRRLALKQRRTEGRRERRERRAARPEALPSAAEVVGQLEVQGEVVAAVLELEEPYRSTIVYRFFHEIGVKEIAEREGVKSKTVESRVTRALGQLRGRLDGKFGGRRAWALALIPLLLPKAAAAATVSTAAVAAVLVVATGAGAWAVVQALPSTEPASRTDAVSSVRLPAMVAVEPAERPSAVTPSPAKRPEAPEPAPLDPPPPGTIEGRVTGNRGLDAKVLLTGFHQGPEGYTTIVSGGQSDTTRETLTDPEGNYSFDGLKPGSYKLKATCEGFAPARGQYWYGVGKEKGVRVDLKFIAGGSLRILVLGRDREPVADREITLHEAREAKTHLGRTDEAGSCEFNPLEKGYYTAEMREGATAYGRAFYIENDQRTHVEIVLGSRLTGLVVGAGGAPLPEAHLQLHLESGDGWLPGTTDEEGRFEIHGAPAGTYKVKVQVVGPGGFHVPAGTLAVGEGGASGCVVRLSSTVISGRLTGKEDGRPVTDRVQIIATPGWAEALPDEEGRYRFPGLEPGSYTIRVRGSDGHLRDEERTVELKENGRVENVDFVVDRHRWGELKLEALDFRGEPATGIVLHLRTPGKRTLYVWRGDGGVHTFRLDAGEYDVEVVRQGWVTRKRVTFTIEEGENVHRSVQWSKEEETR